MLTRLVTVARHPGAYAHYIKRQYCDVEGKTCNMHDRLSDVLCVEDRLRNAAAVRLKRALWRRRHGRVGATW